MSYDMYFLNFFTCIENLEHLMRMFCRTIVVLNRFHSLFYRKVIKDRFTSSYLDHLGGHKTVCSPKCVVLPCYCHFFVNFACPSHFSLNPLKKSFTFLSPESLSSCFNLKPCVRSRITVKIQSNMQYCQ